MRRTCFRAEEPFARGLSAAYRIQPPLVRRWPAPAATERLGPRVNPTPVTGRLPAGHVHRVARWAQ